ncbi:hypothetical protein L2E82_01195 [Cichorium intybus]|uniref:Uncharacterized protein n=1 Tax=Cichorium intybus TaxID=13427 RepID=A0ACB9H0D0_CICIN|nr:hypothetical protein L2E82_01195 [Cichorium intybus]
MLGKVMLLQSLSLPHQFPAGSRFGFGQKRFTNQEEKAWKFKGASLEARGTLQDVGWLRDEITDMKLMKSQCS